jgi:hypothetical protein
MRTLTAGKCFERIASRIGIMYLRIKYNSSPVRIQEKLRTFGNPSVVITRMIDPAGILPKFHKADRSKVKGKVSYCPSHLFKGWSSPVECPKRSPL